MASANEELESYILQNFSFDRLPGKIKQVGLHELVSRFAIMTGNFRGIV